jgi:2-oxoglutarate ferredoxin oxidoreductase subunit delta
LDATPVVHVMGTVMKLWRKPFDQADMATKPSKVLIDEVRCKGCAYCAEFCPLGVLVMSEDLNPKGYALPKVADERECLGCGLCVILCPEFAVQLVPSGDES